MYGLTPEAWRDILRKQGGGCAICGTPKCSTGNRLAVDHCHLAEHLDQKVVRGILCARCNTTIGRAGDSLMWFARCITYLSKHQAKYNLERAITDLKEVLAYLIVNTEGKAPDEKET
ncbi:MAG: endonuclease VII domain-containing protein [Cetobacterium sp.]